jgi:tetratricopeptide (TPR) repeat protein
LWLVVNLALALTLPSGVGAPPGAVRKRGPAAPSKVPAALPAVSEAEAAMEPALLSVKGKEEFEKGTYREAEKLYGLLLAKDPTNVGALNAYGAVLYRSQKFKLAEETFKKVLALAPNDVEAHRTLGIVYYSEQRYDEAVGELTKAIVLKPDDAVAYNYRGITSSQKGWQEAAQKELERAITLDPKYADAYFNLAVVFATQQPPDKGKARENYKRAIELGAEPDSALEQMIK